MPKNLNHEFIELFKESGIKQIDLARQLGFTPTSVSRWMRGHEKAKPVVIAYLRQYCAIKRTLGINGLCSYELMRKKLIFAREAVKAIISLANGGDETDIINKAIKDIAINILKETTTGETE